MPPVDNEGKRFSILAGNAYANLLLQRRESASTRTSRSASATHSGTLSKQKPTSAQPVKYPLSPIIKHEATGPSPESTDQGRQQYRPRSLLWLWRWLWSQQLQYFLAVVAGLLLLYAASGPFSAQHVTFCSRSEEMRRLCQNAMVQLTSASTEEDIRRSLANAIVNIDRIPRRATGVASLITKNVIPCITRLGKTQRCTDVQRLNSALRKTRPSIDQICVDLNMTLTLTHQAFSLVQDAHSLTSREQNALANDKGGIMKVVFGISLDAEVKETQERYRQYEVRVRLLKRDLQNISLGMEIMEKEAYRWLELCQTLDNFIVDVAGWETNNGSTSLRCEIPTFIPSSRRLLNAISATIGEACGS